MWRLNPRSNAAQSNCRGSGGGDASGSRSPSSRRWAVPTPTTTCSTMLALNNAITATVMRSEVIPSGSVLARAPAHITRVGRCGDLREGSRSAHATHAHRSGRSLVKIGGALFLIAVGAILHFAVTADLAGIDLQVVGTILMIVGVVGLVLGLVLMNRSGRAAGPNPPRY